MEADERQIFDGCLQELKTQLIGLFAVRRNLGQFMDDLGSFLIVPAGTLSGAKLANRNDQVCIPAVDLRGQIPRIWNSPVPFLVSHVAEDSEEIVQFRPNLVSWS